MLFDETFHMPNYILMFEIFHYFVLSLRHFDHFFEVIFTISCIHIDMFCSKILLCLSILHSIYFAIATPPQLLQLLILFVITLLLFGYCSLVHVNSFRESPYFKADSFRILADQVQQNRP